MASEKKEQVTSGEKELFTIESLAEKSKISNSVFAGLKLSANWRNGKKVTDDEFKKALDKFLNTKL